MCLQIEKERRRDKQNFGFSVSVARMGNSKPSILYASCLCNMTDSSYTHTLRRDCFISQEKLSMTRAQISNHPNIPN